MRIIGGGLMFALALELIFWRNDERISKEVFSNWVTSASLDQWWLPLFILMFLVSWDRVFVLSLKSLEYLKTPSATFWLAVKWLGIAISIITPPAILIAFHLYLYKIDFLIWILLVPLFISSVFWFGLAAIALAKFSLATIRDARFLHNLKLSKTIDRSEVSLILGVLKTGWAKKVYLTRLSLQRVVASGKWPENFRISIEGGAIDTLLAQLEEKWLKLDK